MTFKLDDTRITIVSTDEQDGETKTSEREAQWNPENGGLMHMTQVRNGFVVLGQGDSLINQDIH